LKDRKIDERLKRIADHYGYEHQMRKATEELAECIVAICHLDDERRDKRGRLSNLLEEIADVRVILEQVVYLVQQRFEPAYDAARMVRSIEIFKPQRTINRLDGNEEESEC
jgi:hypothetical protein